MGNTWMKQSKTFGSPLYEPLLHSVAKKMNPDMPPMPAVPIPAAPAEANNAASMQEMQAERMQQARRKSLSATIYAGAASGMGSAPNVGGSRTQTG